MKHHNDNPLGRAVTIQARVLASLAARLLERNDNSCLAAYMQPSGALVIVAVGRMAERIEGELGRAGLPIVPQHDRKKTAA